MTRLVNEREIYLDCNATHPLLPAVRKGLSQALMNCEATLSNPSSVHRRGQKAKKMVADFRETLCQFLGRGDGDEFILLSGATEGINLAMRGFVADRKTAQRKIGLITSTVEHSAVLDTFRDLKETENSAVLQTELLPVSRSGQLNANQLHQTVDAMLDDPSRDVLLILQLTNNETGVSFEIQNLLAPLFAKYAPKPQTHLPKEKGGRHPHTTQRLWVVLDGAQALGKLDDAYIRTAMHYADYLALSAHKIGGPSGVGTLWVRPNSPFRVQITGGVQERRRRAGTLNSLGALGFHLALQDWQVHGQNYRAHMQRLRGMIAQGLKEIEGCILHGVSENGELPLLPNTLNFHFEGCPEESLLLALDLDGFCLSSGSACNSGSLKPSHVLVALGYSVEEALSSVRVCVGVETTESEVQEFLMSVRAKVEQIRKARIKAIELLGPELSATPSKDFRSL